MSERIAKWYRSEKRLLRPFSLRIWYGFTVMRGALHQCRCARMRVMMTGRNDYQSWRTLFEPKRMAKRVWSPRRAVPFWSRKETAATLQQPGKD